MPIKIPNDLPARQTLEEERVPIIGESEALRQEIRPLRIALLNLMPDKIRTETQLLRALGSTPLQIEVTLLRTSSYTGRNTPITHLQAFYETWVNIQDQRFDALVVTGAPVEQMEFEEVLYWEELQALMDWAETNVHSTFNICWGAQAALYHHYGVPKHALDGKIFGIYCQRVASRSSPLTAGFDDEFLMPVSRYTEVRLEDVEKNPDLEVLAISDRSGLCMLEDRARRRVFVFNHLEYDADTLKREYFRDLEAGLDIHLPENYFPGDDPDQSPKVTWRAHRSLLFGNWINDVYQSTPFDLEAVGRAGRDPAEPGPARLAGRPGPRAREPSKIEA